MTPAAETVRSVMRWSLKLCEDADPPGRSHSPRLASFSFERMMARSDHLTAADIIASYCPSLCTPEGVAEFLSYARRDRRPARVRETPPGLPLARAMVERSRSYFIGEDRRLLEQGSVMTWRGLEDHWPRRVWQSLRDDYERIAEKLYRSEKVFICETSDFVVKVSKMRETVDVV